MTTAATKEKQLTAEDIICELPFFACLVFAASSLTVLSAEDTIRSYYLQPFMFYIHVSRSLVFWCLCEHGGLC